MRESGLWLIHIFIDYPSGLFKCGISPNVDFPGAYADELDSRIGSMTIADVSPRVAVKRIILLYENFQYREAANFINRLSHGTFKVTFLFLNNARELDAAVMLNASPPAIICLYTYWPCPYFHSTMNIYASFFYSAPIISSPNLNLTFAVFMAQRFLFSLAAYSSWSLYLLNEIIF